MRFALAQTRRILSTAHRSIQTMSVFSSERLIGKTGECESSGCLGACDSRGGSGTNCDVFSRLPGTPPHPSRPLNGLYGRARALPGRPLTPALITGASSGIGAATAELFARAGSNIVILARRAPQLEEVKGKCEAAHKKNGHKDAKVVALEMDMTDRKALDGVLGKIGDLKVDM